MGRELILDTGAIIAYDRTGVAAWNDDDSVALPAVVLAEYEVGVLRARGPVEAHRKRTFQELTSGVITLLAYTPATARHHARLLAHAATAGRPRGQHDLIIAAHAAETGRVLVSTDGRARFDDLPGVTVEVTSR